MPPIRLPFRGRRTDFPPDLWTRCPSCQEMLFNKQLEKALRVCPNCGHHFRLAARRRLELLLDGGSFRERDAGLQSVDPLGFADSKPYPDRLAAAQLATGEREAAIWGTGSIEGRPVAICAMDFGFIGGSMGAVVGEKVTRAAEAALAERLPLIVVSASGGARMQEGTFSLMQLAKTMAALERLRAGRVPYISVMTDPTTGGVFASFAAVGDVNLAEPNALIGFAGARVSGGTIAEELPPGFQRAEFLLQHGFVDRIVPRPELRDEIVRLLEYLVPPRPAEASAEVAAVAPGFRPLSFLNALAGRPVETGGDGRSARPAAEAPATVPTPTMPAVPATTGLGLRPAHREAGSPPAEAAEAPKAGEKPEARQFETQTAEAETGAAVGARRPVEGARRG